LQAFKDMVNPKDKKNLVLFGMLLTQLIRNARINVSKMEPFVGALQLKWVTFVKIGITDKLPEYGQKHIKRKVKKEEP